MTWLGSIRLGLALNTLVKKYVHYLLCATYFGAMVVDVEVFTIEKIVSLTVCFLVDKITNSLLPIKATFN